MKILIDIGHPAHVYLFKNMALEMQKKGHSFYFTVREGENEYKLLEKYQFNYSKIGNKKKSKYGKLMGLLIFSLKILNYAIKFKPDLFISHGSMYAGLAAFFYRKPHIALEDTGNMEQIRFSKPVSSVIISPDILPVFLGKKHIRCKSYHEISYLHPKYFTPNDDIYKYLNIEKKDKYAVVRFVSWGASHDIGQKGFEENEKFDLINLLSNYCKVLISSESKLPKELEKYQINIPFDKIHDALYFASIYVGEGATMASECAMLGTPAIYVSTIEAGTINEQQNFGLVNQFKSYFEAKDKIIELIEDKNIKCVYKKRHAAMIKNKIDFTAFLIWFVEHYPQSFKIMKENPDYQLRFA